MKTLKTVASALVLAFGVAAMAAQNTGPASWPNAYRAPDGTIWSDVFPSMYPNCISRKDAQGKPIDDGIYGCQTDSNGNLLGTSSDGLTVLDSDAVQACKAIGGELPTLQDFVNLGDHYKDLPDMYYFKYWTSSVAFEASAQYFVGEFGGVGHYARFEYTSVRCVSRAKGDQI